VKKTIPAREGYVYEEPKKYHHMIDNDKSPENAMKEIKTIIAKIFNNK
jgi:hypothetical protein